MPEATVAPAVPENQAARRLIFWGTSIVVAHYIAIIWHVMLLVRIQPGFPRQGIVALLLVNLVPVSGVLAFAKGFPRSAAAVVIVPLATGLLIGGYSHFFGSAADNVLRMQPGAMTLAFRSSAVLLLVLEALGCWVAGQMYKSA
jgi:hypothetical protein